MLTVGRCATGEANAPNHYPAPEPGRIPAAIALTPGIGTEPTSQTVARAPTDQFRARRGHHEDAQGGNWSQCVATRVMRLPGLHIKPGFPRQPGQLLGDDLRSRDRRWSSSRLVGEHGRPGDGPGGCSRVVTCARILILTRFGRAEYVHQHSRLKRAGSCSTTIFLGSSSQTRTRWWIP